MRAFCTLLLVVACHEAAPPAPPRAPVTAPTAPVAKKPPPLATPKAERLAARPPRATVEGATFIAPAGWSLTVRGPATILETPEAGSRIALIDVHAQSADAASRSAFGVASGGGFFAPRGAPAPTLEPPEAGSRIALIDAHAQPADAASRSAFGVASGGGFFATGAV